MVSHEGVAARNRAIAARFAERSGILLVFNELIQQLP